MLIRQSCDMHAKPHDKNEACRHFADETDLIWKNVTTVKTNGCMPTMICNILPTTNSIGHFTSNKPDSHSQMQSDSQLHDVTVNSWGNSHLKWQCSLKNLIKRELHRQFQPKGIWNQVNTDGVPANDLFFGQRLSISQARKENQLENSILCRCHRRRQAGRKAKASYLRQYYEKNRYTNKKIYVVSIRQR